VADVTALDARAKGKLAEQMVPVAAALACAVRDMDSGGIGELLAGFTRQEFYGLAVVLAGMVPVDEPVTGLLGWVTWDERMRPLRERRRQVHVRSVPLQPCGTHAAFVRHRSNDERPCDACSGAEKAYQKQQSDARTAARESAA
jgi:hypothetical protein